MPYFEAANIQNRVGGINKYFLEKIIEKTTQKTLFITSIILKIEIISFFGYRSNLYFINSMLIIMFMILYFLIY